MPSTRWSDYPEQTTALEACLKADLQWYEVGQVVSRFGPPRTATSCQSRARDTGLSAKIKEWELEQDSDKLTGMIRGFKANEIDKLERQVKFYKGEVGSANQRASENANLVEQMKTTLAAVEPTGVWAPPTWKPEQEEEEAIALFSDAQIGTKSLGAEVGLIKPEVYGPFGEFNFDIFRYRLRIWTQAVQKIVELHRSKIPVNTLNLWFLGDVLENEFIYKGQGAYIETGLMQQFFMSQYEVAQAIAILASNFREIRVRGVHGNHGRGTEKPRTAKTFVNWEFIWYRYLELICRDLHNVTFDFQTSWFDIVDVQGHSFLMMHGEDIRRYMRFPWYSVDIMEKAYGAILERVKHPFEVLVFGHHHVASNFQTSRGEWFCNGNWVGPTTFTIKVLREMATPKQWLLFCHPKRSVASRWPVDLMQENQDIWDSVKASSYDIHVPVGNRDILAAMDASAKTAAWADIHPRKLTSN